MSKRFYALAAAALAASTSTAALAASDDVSTSTGTEMNATADADLDTGATGLSGTGTVNSTSELETDAETGSINVTGSEYTSTGGKAEFKTYGDVISELKKSRQDGFDLSALETDADDELTVETVTLSNLKGNAAMEARALEQEVNDQADALQELRDRLKANADVTAAIEAEGDGYTADDVVAYRASGDGHIILVIDDLG